MKESIAASAKPFSYWLSKNWYYHGLIKKFYKFVIPTGGRVLHVGSKSGYLLEAVKPQLGVGIDTDSEAIAQAQSLYPSLTFYAGEVNCLPAEYCFDYIILSSITMEVYDIQQLFESLKKYSHSGTRIIIDCYSSLWEPILWLAQEWGLRRPTSLNNWISTPDLKNFLQLAGFEYITAGRHILIPLSIPGISWFCNTLLAHIPGINRLCVNKWLIARPLPQRNDHPNVKVSVVIPCKNERGNIQDAITRTPVLGMHTEFIFVDGNSQDGTYEEIERVAQLYPEKNITYFKQDGVGKGDAVRKGFAHATGDVLMILDADLTTPPEELPKFLEALVHGKGEFINGSRLIYGMEHHAMRFLNLIANHGFSLGFSWLLGQRIKDTLCGTKVLYKKDYEKIVAHRSYFGNFDPYGDFDLIFGAAKQNLKIIDMPVHYKNRTYGTSQISRFTGGYLLLRMSFIALKKFKFYS